MLYTSLADDIRYLAYEALWYIPCLDITHLLYIYFPCRLILQKLAILLCIHSTVVAATVKKSQSFHMQNHYISVGDNIVLFMTY